MLETVAWAAFGAIAVGLSLGIFGSGGSILTVPVLVFLLHHDAKVAIAESLGIVGAIALIAAVPYARRGLVDWRTAALFGLPGVAGAVAGSWIASHVPGYVQMIVFGVTMGTAAVFMWRRSAPGSTEQHADELPRRASLGAATLQGFGVGAMTGFVGVGGGFLIVPALAAVARLPIRRAVATSLVVIVVNCIAGLARHHHALTDLGASPDWLVMGIFVVVGGLGSVAGSRIQARINQRVLRRAFAVFLLVMAGFILARESIALARDDTSPVAR